MADFGNQTKLFFLSQIDNLRDPVRNTRWRLLIPSTIFAASGIEVTNGDQFNIAESGTDDFALHVKTCEIPEITLAEQSHNYMGFPSFYPVNATIHANFPFQTILLEDMRAYEAILAWQQACINTGLLVEEDGVTDRMNQTGLRLGLGNHKDVENPTFNVIRNNDIKVQLYNWMRGDVIANVRLINARPTSVKGPTGLTQAPDANLLNFNFNLHCDRWSLHIPKDYLTGV